MGCTAGGMPSPLRFALLVAVLTVACSDDSKDHSRPSPSDTAPGGGGDAGAPAGGGDTGGGDAARPKSVCSTLDYGHERPNAEYYLTFADDAAALKYAQDFLAASGLPGASEVSHDAKITELVDRIYGAFRGIFPRETEGMDAAPRVVTVGDRGVNAFTGFDDRAEVNKAPWLLFVHGPALQHPSSAELAGMLAHELGHLVTRDLLPETRAKIRTHYRVAGGVEQGILGAAAEDDPVIRARTEEIREIGQKVGRHAIMGPMPLSPYLVPDYESLLGTLKDQRDASADGGACKAAEDGIAQMKGIYTPGASVHEYTTLHLTTDQSAALADLGASTADALRRCYANVRASLFELKVRQKASKGPASEAAAMIQKALDPTSPEHEALKEELMTMDVERDADADSARPTIERLLGVVDALHGRLTDYEADASLPIDELRVFDMEEDADDTAVRILKAIGEDPLANARIWVNTMPDPDACFREVDGGEVPLYGRFVDPHNDTCWRYYHSIQFADALARCPADGPSPAARKSGPTPISSADPSPMLLVRRRVR